MLRTFFLRPAYQIHAQIWDMDVWHTWTRLIIVISPSNHFEIRWYPVGYYMSKVNNRNTKTRCETSSKLTIKTPERRQEFVMFLLNFEQVNSSWVVLFFDVFYTQYTIVTCRLMFKTLTMMLTISFWKNCIINFNIALNDADIRIPIEQFICHQFKIKDK